MHEHDMTETQNSVIVDEEDLPIYIRVYRSLNETFRGRTQFILLHVVDDIWKVRVIGLISREWLEFCANVFAELPSTVVDLVKEAAPYSEAAELGNSIPFEEVDDDDALEDAAAEEEAKEEYEDDDTEEDEEEEEDTTNEDGETPSEEIQRKLRKAKIVRKTGSSAVTVEAD